MADDKQDPDTTHILDPSKDEHTDASGKPSIKLTGTVCSRCGGSNGQHYNICPKTN